MSSQGLSPSPFEPGSLVDRTSARAWPAAFFSSRACVRLVLSLALLPGCAWPQTEAATVFGTVTDPSGALIAGAQVTILNQSTGVKRDFNSLERRRMKAAKLLDQGLSEAEVARRVGVHRQSVNRFKKCKSDAG